MTPGMLVEPNDDDMKELFDNALAGYEVVKMKPKINKNKG